MMTILNSPIFYYSILIPIVVGMILVIYVIIQAANEGVQRDLAKTLSKRWKVSLTKGGFFSAPRLYVHVGGLDIHIRAQKATDKSQPFTSAECPINNLYNDDINITPETTLNRIGKFFGMKELELGDKEFDDKFYIKGKNENRAHLILNHNVKSKILAFFLPPHVVIKNKLAKVEIVHYLANQKECDEFIEQSSGLLQALVKIVS